MTPTIASVAAAHDHIPRHPLWILSRRCLSLEPSSGYGRSYVARSYDHIPQKGVGDTRFLLFLEEVGVAYTDGGAYFFVGGKGWRIAGV